MSLLLLLRKRKKYGVPAAADAKQRQIKAELKVFTDWLAAQGVPGVLGEFGVPNNADTTSWGNALDYYYKLLNAAGVWPIKWASGNAWGTSYNLGDWVDNAGSSGVIAQEQAQVPIIKPYQSATSGITFSGAEFGMSGTAYTRGAFHRYPDAASIAYLAGKGVKLIRIPVPWELLQPTLLAALDTTELSNLDVGIQACYNNNIKVIIDIHNYARYTDSGAVTTILSTSGTVNGTHLADLWTKISTWVKANSNRNTAVIAYELMNEPHDMVAEPGAFSGTTRYTWDATVNGWAPESVGAVAFDNTVSRTGAGSLKVSTPSLTAGATSYIRFNDAGTKAGGALSGNTLSAWVKLPSGVTGSWTAFMEWQNSSFQWQGGTAVNLVAGSWVEVKSTYGSISSPNAFGMQINYSNAPAGVTNLNIDDFAQGTLAGGKTAAQVWEGLAQAAVNAIRANSDTRTILVAGYEWSHAHNWSTNHPTKFITDSASNHRYVAHHYWDNNKSGSYANSYATELTNSVNAGY